MDALYDALMVACDSYEAMQQAHLCCLTGTAQPDIERLDFEQARLCADLQNHLMALVYQMPTTPRQPGALERLRTRLAALQAGDAALAAALHAYRATLAQHRAEVQYRQKALAGYGGLATPPSPTLVDTSG